MELPTAEELKVQASETELEQNLISTATEPQSPSTTPAHRQSTIPLKKHARSNQNRPKKQKLECRDYIIEFKGNNSKQWDGKKIPVDGEWIEELLKSSFLFPGRMLELPWKGNQGEMISRKAVLISLPDNNN